MIVCATFAVYNAGKQAHTAMVITVGMISPLKVFLIGWMYPAQYSIMPVAGLTYLCVVFFLHEIIYQSIMQTKPSPAKLLLYSTLFFNHHCNAL